MKRACLAAAVLVSTLAWSVSTAASEYGTAEQARAMLERAITMLEQDEAKALAAFNDSEGGFRDRDLYVFCGGPDGNFSAHPRATGRGLRTLRDVARKPFGEEMYRVATPETISTVTYLMAPRGSLPREKTSLITRVSGQICGVGYFKPGAPSAHAINDYAGQAIEGYDPVAYFTLGRATLGSDEFNYQWLGAEWWFVSAAHRLQFIDDPIRYAPQYGGYCAGSLPSGRMLAADPTVWQIVDGRLYLMFSQRHRKKWQNDRAANITEAKVQWQALRAMMPE